MAAAAADVTISHEEPLSDMDFELVANSLSDLVSFVSELGMEDDAPKTPFPPWRV